jgi:DNA-binding NtrC family response regulator
MYEAMAITDPQVVSLPFMETIRDRLVVVPRPPKADKLKCFGLLYGSSSAMQSVYDLIERVAQTDATVLIVGESGSGKELVANTIHRKSPRAKQPFVAVNCGAIPATLIEAELFGYEKGAFTGAAKTHRGYLERAVGGTLFLDEITEMPTEMQVRLLRVLETGTFSRVGGDQEGQAEGVTVPQRVLTETVGAGLKLVHLGGGRLVHSCRSGPPVWAGPRRVDG